MRIITHKTECFPTDEQKIVLAQNFGMRNFYFNKTIEFLQTKYGDLKENKKLITKKEVMLLRKTLFREKYMHLVKTAPAMILDTAMEDVMYALNSLWKKGKSIKLRDDRLIKTCRFYNKNVSAFNYDTGSKYINLTRLSNLKLAEALRWNDANIKTVTIKKQAGRYFIAITLKTKALPKAMLTHEHVGIDWGIKTYLTICDGKNFNEIDFDKLRLNNLYNRTVRTNRRLKQKIQDSNNYNKQLIKHQKTCMDFENFRDDLIKKAVKQLADKVDSVTLEDLGMYFVASNKSLAKAASHKPFYKFKIALVNKFHQLGKTVYSVSKNYPSTQKCSSCGNVKSGTTGINRKLKLGENMYICNECGAIHDRDQNAAMNLYLCREGLSIITPEIE